MFPPADVYVFTNLFVTLPSFVTVVINYRHSSSVDAIYGQHGTLPTDAGPLADFIFLPVGNKKLDVY